MDLRSGRPAPCNPAFRGNARCLSAVVFNSRQPRNSILPSARCIAAARSGVDGWGWGGIKSLIFSGYQSRTPSETNGKGIEDG